MKSEGDARTGHAGTESLRRQSRAPVALEETKARRFGRRTSALFMTPSNQGWGGASAASHMT